MPEVRLVQFIAKKLQALVAFDYFRIGDELVDQFLYQFFWHRYFLFKLHSRSLSGFG